MDNRAKKEALGGIRKAARQAMLGKHVGEKLPSLMLHIGLAPPPDDDEEEEEEEGEA
jgi:hypothetical protein